MDIQEIAANCVALLTLNNAGEDTTEFINDIFVEYGDEGVSDVLDGMTSIALAMMDLAGLPHDVIIQQLGATSYDLLSEYETP